MDRGRLQEIRSQIVQVCRSLYSKGLIAGTDGNVSVRLSDEAILSTPSGVHKGFLEEEALVVVDRNGELIKGRERPSSELPLHLAIYGRDPDARAIVHAHPPWILALSLTGYKLQPHLVTEARMFLGRVAVVPFEKPGSSALAAAVLERLDQGLAQVMAHHGAVTRGSSLQKAFELMECLEHTARITALANLLGRPEPLPD